MSKSKTYNKHTANSRIKLRNMNSALPIVVTGQVVSKSAIPSVRGAAASCGRREEARGRETSGPGHQTPPARLGLGLESLEISAQ